MTADGITGRDDADRCELTTFYNGACPVCRTEINMYRRYAARKDLPLGWRNIAEDPGELARHGLDAEDVKRRLYAVDQDGRLHGGVDAFLLLWHRMPRYRPLAWLVRQRIVRPVADILYERMMAPALYRWHKRRERRGKVGGRV